MAKKKKSKKPQSIGQVFFGTLKQAAYTLVGIFVIIAILVPGLAQTLIERLLFGLSPLISVAFVCLIIFGAFGLMFRRK